MKKILIISLLFCPLWIYPQDATVSSPDGKLGLSIAVKTGVPFYSVKYNGKTILEDSPLGFISNIGDFSKNMTFEGKNEGKIDKSYIQDKIKTKNVHYVANELTIRLKNAENKEIEVVFRVSANDIAFRYQIPRFGGTMSCVIEKETTGFRFPSFTTTFLSTMMAPMGGWGRSTPSYENGYEADGALCKPTRNNEGYVFPGLFHVGDNGWALVSETGVSSLYCASHLKEGKEGLYTVGFPNMLQNNGFGSSGASFGLPGTSPWRTITVGDNLKPIVETTIAYDLVEPLYEPSQEYRYGRSTWSWIVWQDASMNYDDQVKFIDLANAMGYEYILIDALWDVNLGKTKLEELVNYAHSKNVDVFLWYNSNGGANDAPQGPRDVMNTSVARKKEMKWLKEIGIKGLKIDFFGGDKQETMRLYEDILSDANDFGLMIIFHGCTLPRGWERMYPNFVGAEAVVASENLVFSQQVREQEAFNACLHPFIRNAVACMEFGGTFLNKYLNRSNSGRNLRLTSDVFQLATAVLFQNPIQNFALTPDNLTGSPAFAIEFMKKVPTVWDEICFIDGYPGKYVVLARRNGSQWYLAAVNAESQAMKLKLNLPFFAGKTVDYYSDDKTLVSSVRQMKINAKGEAEIIIQPNGGVILKN